MKKKIHFIHGQVYYESDSEIYLIGNIKPNNSIEWTSYGKTLISPTEKRKLSLQLKALHTV